MNELGYEIEDTLLWRHNQAAPDYLELGAAKDLLANAQPLQQPCQGTVFGTLLNDQNALDALGQTIEQAPYKAAPKAPVLYIKPRNTHCGHRSEITLPAGIENLQIGAALGLVFGRTASRVSAQDALTYLAGYTIVNDLSVAHSSFYRPGLPNKVRDHSCAIGPWILSPRHVADPDNLLISVRIDDEICQQASTATMVRKAASLIQDVTEFMTINAGDILLTGVAAGAPLARAGQKVSITIDGVGTLENFLVAAS